MNDWIAKRTYVGPAVIWGFGRLHKHRDRIRSEAMWFANRELDPDAVVSVTETAAANSAFSVTVWYRADAEHVETVYMTNSDLREPIGTLTRAVADASDERLELGDLAGVVERSV